MAMTFSDEELSQKYIHYSRIRGIAEITIEKRQHVLRQFRNFIEQRGKHLLEIEKGDIEAYIEFQRLERGVADQTLDIRLSNISGFYEFLEYEELIDFNIIPKVKARFSRNYKSAKHTHKIISVSEMSALIRSASDIRDKALMCLMAKTGIRRNELINLDLSDIDLDEQKIRLKPTAKRSNTVVFFDDEAEDLLRRWLRSRTPRNKKNLPALFIGVRGDRLEARGVDYVIRSHALRLGLHDPTSDSLEDHFTSHCFRHWLTTNLALSGMPRHFIKEIRGDANRDAVDGYIHITPKQLKEAYIIYVPHLGI
jgi:Site-specific recombinase XerD